MARNLLADPSMSTLQVRYEDMAWNMDAVIQSVKAFVPEVSNIDPWRSSLSDDSGAERGLPVGKYFQQKPPSGSESRSRPRHVQTPVPAQLQLRRGVLLLQLD